MPFQVPKALNQWKVLKMTREFASQVFAIATTCKNDRQGLGCTCQFWLIFRTWANHKRYLLHLPNEASPRITWSGSWTKMYFQVWLCSFSVPLIFSSWKLLKSHFIRQQSSNIHLYYMYIRTVFYLKEQGTRRGDRQYEAVCIAVYFDDRITGNFGELWLPLA